MKRIFLFISLSLIVLLAVSHKIIDFPENGEHGIQFYNGTWDEALDAAAKENKLIFVDVYATWCGPCKVMKRHTFSNAKVGSYYNQNFINVAFDGENGEGRKLAQKYSVTAYPTLLFVNAEGNLVKQAVGYHNPKQFLKIGKKMIKE